MNQAEGVIEVPFHERKTGVFTADGNTKVLFKIGIDIQHNDLATWSHYIFDGDIV